MPINMGANKIIIFTFVIMALYHPVWMQDLSNPLALFGLGGGSGNGGIPNPLNFLSGAAKEFASPFTSILGGLGSRNTRAAEEEDSDEDSVDTNNRFFFHSFPTLTGCNYTTQAGATCTGCRQALLCLPNNIGKQTNCIGLFPYCNGGRCSLTQGSLCTNSTG